MDWGRLNIRDTWVCLYVLIYNALHVLIPDSAVTFVYICHICHMSRKLSQIWHFFAGWSEPFGSAEERWNLGTQNRGTRKVVSSVWR